MLLIKRSDRRTNSRSLIVMLDGLPRRMTLVRSPVTTRRPTLEPRFGGRTSPLAESETKGGLAIVLIGVSAAVVASCAGSRQGPTVRSAYAVVCGPNWACSVIHIPKLHLKWRSDWIFKSWAEERATIVGTEVRV